MQSTWAGGSSRMKTYNVSRVVGVALIAATLFLSIAVVSCGASSSFYKGMWEHYVQLKEEAHDKWSAANKLYWEFVGHRADSLTEALRSLGVSIASFGMGLAPEGVAAGLESLYGTGETLSYDYWVNHWKSQAEYWDQKWAEYVRTERSYYSAYVRCASREARSGGTSSRTSTGSTPPKKPVSRRSGGGYSRRDVQMRWL